MKEYNSQKVFVLVHGEYQEISLDEHYISREKDEQYQQKKFISLHGAIMEVSESDYIAFYREKRREKYLEECANARGDLSYDALNTDEFVGENIVVAQGDELFEVVWRALLLDKLRLAIPMLTETEKDLIHSLYFMDLSERECAQKYAVSHNAIHKRKLRILSKLKKLLEK